MFVGEKRVIAATRFLECSIDDPLRGFANLARCDIEILYVHGGLRQNKRQQEVRQR
jgi:hypothetical protein